MYFIGFNVVLIVVAMIIILWTISKKSKTIKRALEIQRASENASTSSEDELKISELRYARVLVVQGLMYVFAYFITWIFMVIPVAAKVDHDSLNIIQVFKSIFMPMQGFWNLIIFIYDKAYLIYHDDEYQSYWKIVKIVLFHPDKAPEIILPDSLKIERQNSSAGDRNNEETRNAGQVALSPSMVRGSIVEDIEHSMESDYSSTSSSNEVIHRDGIVYRGEENRRFYLDSNGLRRTGQMEDRRHGRVEFYTTASIESPGAFAGNSNGSDVLSVSEEQSLVMSTRI